LSDEGLPEPLARLIGQHPAAIRSVCFSEGPHERDALAHLEIETKHGFVILIHHRTGAVYSNPPVPPGVDTGRFRQQQDLSDALPGAFADRPRFAAVEAVRDGENLAGWRFLLDTGAAFTLTLDERLPIVAA
jgi:hypothetical protein